jgi:hypothetical protein
MKPLHSGDVHESWCDDYVSSLGVWVEPAQTPADQWRRFKAAWRKHKQRRSERWLRWQDAVKEFNAACKKLDLEPEAVLRVLTAQILSNKGDIARREIAAMNLLQGENRLGGRE